MSLPRHVNEAVRAIADRSRISRLMIGLSGGKDSLCLCELVRMAGAENVGYFFMEFLPDLRIQEDLLDYPCRRFGIDKDSIFRVPSEHFIKCMHYSAYTWHSKRARKDFPDMSRTDVYRYVAKANRATIVVGVKKADSMQMMRMVTKGDGTCIYPMENWSLNDVLTFMRDRSIAIPPLTKSGCRGVGISYNELKFIYDNYPDDFARIERVFPFCRALLLSHSYFGIKDTLRVI